MAEIITDGDQFPYYSSSLGCWIRSRKHRDEVERRMGVTRITADDVEEGIRRRERADAEIDRRIERLNATESRHPGHAKIRELMKRGFFTAHLEGEKKKKAQRGLEARMRKHQKRGK